MRCGTDEQLHGGLCPTQPAQCGFRGVRDALWQQGERRRIRGWRLVDERPTGGILPARQEALDTLAVNDPAVPGIEPGEATSPQVAIRRTGVDATSLCQL